MVSKLKYVVVILLCVVLFIKVVKPRETTDVSPRPNKRIRATYDYLYAPSIKASTKSFGTVFVVRYNGEIVLGSATLKQNGIKAGDSITVGKDGTLMTDGKTIKLAGIDDINEYIAQVYR